MKKLKDFMKTYRQKSDDLQKEIDELDVDDKEDVAGNKDDVFKASKIKTIDRKGTRHGYGEGEDEKVYEEVEDLDELSRDTMRMYHGKANVDRIDAKRDKEEAEYRFDPAVKAQASEIIRKRSAGIKMVRKKLKTEEVEDLDELSQKMVRAYRDKAKDDKESAEDDREYYKAHDDNTDDEDKKIRKRGAGIAMANKKIHGGAKVPVKEDAELEEKTLTPAEMKKREQVVKALKKQGMDKPKAYAIATATAKKVAESTDAYGKSIDDIKKKNISGGDMDKISKISAMLKAEKKPVKEEAEEIDESAKVADHLIKRYGENVRKSHVRSAANDFGVGYVALAHAVRKKLGVNRLEEEQIDEISSKTLSSYGKKAKKEAEANDDPMHRYSGRLMASKKTNPARGGYKLTKVAATFGEEAEELDEKLSDEAKTAIRHAVAGRGAKVKPLVKLAQMGKKTSDKPVDEAVGDVTMRIKSPKEVWQQHTSPKKSKSVVPTDPKTGKTLYQKVTNEEAEQIDELSRKTLGNYTYKAASELGSKGITTGLKIAADEPTEKNFKKMANRQKGVATAVKKLTKEEIINRTIEKYVPEDYVLPSATDRFLARVSDLPEGHIGTLLAVFESLSEDNQLRMIDIAETKDGINGLINFALDMRAE